MSEEPVVYLEDVTIGVGAGVDRFELSATCFRLLPGECVAVIGPSGSGKSLFLEAIGLLRQPVSAGRFDLALSADGVFDAARAWRQADTSALARCRLQGIGFLLQTGGLLKSLTVEANIRLPAAIAGRPADSLSLLDALQLTAQRRLKPAALSGGQRQRAALLRALSAAPGLLLADEPTAALDPGNADRVMELLVDTVRRGALKAAIIATHDAERARRFGMSLVEIVAGSTAAGGRATVDSRAMLCAA